MGIDINYISTKYEVNILKNELGRAQKPDLCFADFRNIFSDFGANFEGVLIFTPTSPFSMLYTHISRLLLPKEKSILQNWAFQSQ